MSVVYRGLTPPGYGCCAASRLKTESSGATPPFTRHPSHFFPLASLSHPVDHRLPRGVVGVDGGRGTGELDVGGALGAFDDGGAEGRVGHVLAGPSHGAALERAFHGDGGDL